MITLEKVLVLKSVALFGQTPDELLVEVAQALEEVHVSSGETIVNKGDAGTAMYIIVEGEVKVHDGDNTAAQLGPREVFGEFAALSTIVRTASVTALQDTLLLKLESDTLYDVMNLHIGLARGMIGALCHRIADIIAQAH